MTKPSRLRSTLILFAVLALASFASMAQTSCPWLNAATAAGAMGGPVLATVVAPPAASPDSTKATPTYAGSETQRKDRADTSCEFRRDVNSVAYVLRIQVDTLANPVKDFAAALNQCSSRVSLTGIGNEAYQCLGANNSGPAKSPTETIIARVRNRAFRLTLDHAPDASALEDKSGLRPGTRNIAEQIAGSLF